MIVTSAELRGKNECIRGDGDFEYKGYKSNGSKSVTLNENIPDKKCDLTETGIADLKNIISTCKQKNIKLLFIYSPEYNMGLQKHILNAKDIFAFIDKTAKENAVPYFRDDSLSISSNSNLFANAGHLNTQGAAAYSIILANRLKTMIGLNTTITIK